MAPTELISQSITEWIQGLNYQYMAIVLIINYGLRYKSSMLRIREKLGGSSLAPWYVGLIIAFTEILSTFSFLGGHGVNLNTFILLFHSYLLVMIFSEDITKKIHDWIEFIIKKESD